MPKLTIILEVDADPRDEDPHDVAEDIIAHAVDQSRFGNRVVQFVSAEWGEHGRDS